MTAAATVTAKFGQNLMAANAASLATSNSTRSRPPVFINNHKSENPTYSRHRSAPRIVGPDEPDPLEVRHSNSFMSKARREFFEEQSELRANGRCSDQYENNALDTARSRQASSNESVFSGDRTANSCPQSPEGKGSGTKRGSTAFSSPSSSSSANSLTFSSGASLGCCSNDLKSTYTEEILKVLEEDGLVLQACPRDNLPPLPISLSERRASADYNVIELSRQYRKKELSQLRSSSERFQHISDIYRLQQMLNSTDDEDKRRAIRQRLAELKNQSKENSQPGGQRARSLSTREMSSHEEGSPLKDGAMLGGIASLTVSPFRTARSSPTSSPGGNGYKGGTPNGQTIKIVARTPVEIKSALLRWCQIRTRGYPILITNFTRSWADGLAFCALVHSFFPNAFDFSKLDAKNRRENFELAFRVAEEMAGIVPLLEVDDMISMGDNPEYKCVYTYIQSMYKSLHDLE